jgi:anaerobic ribonucleoside-triphosphate reductase activating protein
MHKVASLLRLHQFLPFSRANGPGARAVIWVQGCSLGCPGCFNPDTHSFANGELVPVDDLFQKIADLKDSIEGITISGGEPLQQCEPLALLLERIRGETSLSVLIFTGYTWEELLKRPGAERILSCTDVLIAGRYVQEQRIARGMRGSNNKTIHLLTNRYTMADLEAVPTTEIIITEKGDVILSGINPVNH